MKKRTWVSAVVSMAGLLFTGSAVAHDRPDISPEKVEALIYPGTSHEIRKKVRTGKMPSKLDVCLLEDETGSFGDDIASLRAAAEEIFDEVVDGAPDAQFAVAGFRDYPIAPYGDVGDWVYRRVSRMSPDKEDWLGGIEALTASGGFDAPEVQFDSLVAAAGPGVFADPTLGPQPDCGWREEAGVTRVLVVATDAPFHVPGPGKPHVHDLMSTISALEARGIIVVGLKAPGAELELDALASATGGSVLPVASDGSDIASAILAGLSTLPATVRMVSDCAAPIGTAFAPPEQTVLPGEKATFVERISVAEGASGGTYRCRDWALVNGAPLKDHRGHILYEHKKIHVPGITAWPVRDTNELEPGASHRVTARVAAGDEGELRGVRVRFDILSGPNAGRHFAGKSDHDGKLSWKYSPLQGPAGLGTDRIQASFLSEDGGKVYGRAVVTKQWVDDDRPEVDCVRLGSSPGVVLASTSEERHRHGGIFRLLAEDEVWPASGLRLYVTDKGSGTVFGPFAVGTTLRYVKSSHATPESRPDGGSVDYVIVGRGTPVLTAVDGSGNTSYRDTCRLP